MTKDAFIAKHLDELVGLLVTSFADKENTKAGSDPDMAARGRAMLAQMRRARELIGRMWDDTQTNGKAKE
jgi:hypothetical protein